MSTVFGPVASRRFGRSLGIDLSPNTKQCNFDCLYCELEPEKPVERYDDIVPVDVIADELKKRFAEYGDSIDVLTVTANGEPTLYPDLDILTDRLNEIKSSVKTLILSNGSTVSLPGTRKILRRYDIVKLSLDCASQRCFKRIDRPAGSIKLEDIKKGMLTFSGEYEGNLIIEILLVAGINDNESEIMELNDFLLRLKPARVDIGTIDRPPAYAVKAVPHERIRELSGLFDPALHINVACKTETDEKKKFSYSTGQILDTISKRPLTEADIETLFDRKSVERLKSLEKKGDLVKIDNNGVLFYIRA